MSDRADRRALEVLAQEAHELSYEAQLADNASWRMSIKRAISGSEDKSMTQKRSEVVCWGLLVGVCLQDCSIIV